MSEITLTIGKIRERLKEYQADPVKFVKEVIGISPTAQQAELLMAAAPRGARVAVTSGHGCGKSSSLAWLIIWALCVFGNDVTIACTAPSGHQLKDVLWSEVFKWRAQMHPWFRKQLEVTAERIKVVGDILCYAVARTSRAENPDALQGFHATHMFFIIDEAPGVPDAIFIAGRGSMSTHGSRTILTGNPTRTSGFFYDAFQSPNWVKLHFDCNDSPLVDPEWIKEMKHDYGEDSDVYKVRVLGQFPSHGVKQLISTDAVKESVERYIDEHMFANMPKILGADCAHYGNNRSVLTLRQGIFSKVLFSGSRLDTVHFAGVINNFWDATNVDACFVDMGGVGAGVVDQLRALGRNPLGVNFGSKADNPDLFANKRAEMWVRMRDWIEQGGVLPPTPDLLHKDLVLPDYGYTSSGKLQLERKEDIIKRTGKSPDMADSLALTFAQHVTLGQGLVHRVPRPVIDVLDLDWDRERH
jgi:hypothetical protein